MDINTKFPPVLSAYMQSDARHRWVLGPFGSGKSVSSMMEIPRRAAMQRPNSAGKRKTRFAVVRNTRPQLRDTTMKTWFDYFPNGSLGSYHGLSNTYVIKQGDIECEVVFRPLDDESDVRNLLSFELTGAYLNEFRDINRAIVEALDGRIGRYPRMEEGGPTWMGMWGDSNMPAEGSYWERMLEGYDPDKPKERKPNTWEKFIQPPAMIKQLDGSYITNPLAENLSNLPPGYYQNLIANKSPDYIRTYVMCTYGLSLGGQPVHPRFSREHHVSKLPLIPNQHNLLLLSADFGHTPAISFQEQNAFGQLLLLDEVVTFGSSLERAIEEKVLPLMRRRFDGHDCFVTGDPSGSTGSDSDMTSCADIFRRYARKGLGKVKFAYSNAPLHRQVALDDFLSRTGDNARPMFLVDPRCEWSIQALGGKFQFRKFKDGRESSEVEGNDHSHIGDAIQYGAMYWFRGGRRKAEIQERLTDPWARPAQAPERNIYNTPR